MSPLIFLLGLGAVVASTGEATGKLELAKVIFGTSTLGNLYTEPTHEEKCAVVKVSGLQVQPASADSVRSIRCLTCSDLLLSLSPLGSHLQGDRE
jgi:hypothetical protein